MLMKKLLLGMALTLPLTLPQMSQAGIITLNFNQSACESAIGGPGATSICNQVNTQLDDAINQDLPDTNFDDYAGGISNAMSVAAAGTADYSDKFEYFVIKPSFGLGISANDISSPETSGGAGFSGNLVFGLNMNLLPVDKIGPIDMKKLDVFVNIFSYGLDMDAGDGNFKGDIGSFGIHARYHLMEGSDFFLGEWGGLFLHTGFQRTTMDLSFSTPIDIGQDINVSGETANIQNANVAFGMESAITTIPIEISTYLRFLYAFTAFGGLGMDITSGTTDVNLDSAGDMILTSQGNANLGDIVLDDTSSGDPNSFGFRAFAGLQLNLPFFRLYGQVQKPLGQDTLGTNFGLKVLW